MIHFYTFAARLAYCRNSWRSLNQEFMVSIVLVTYNRAARLRLSIQDILDQTFKDFELIICDDCSTDSTESVCRQFEQRDPRIRYFRHPQNMKMPGNCNFGIEQAKFDYVAILHDGDRFKPELELVRVRVERSALDLVAYELAVKLFLSEVDAEVERVQAAAGVAA